MERARLKRTLGFALPPGTPISRLAFFDPPIGRLAFPETAICPYSSACSLPSAITIFSRRMKGVPFLVR